MEKETALQVHEVLKAEYVKLLNDKDVLINWGKPQLEALYATRIGVHQIALLQLQLNVQALKRKIELIQAAINTQQPYDIIQIELTVATELAKLESEIMQQTATVNQAKLMLSSLDTPQRSAELKHLFKQLAKQLHPDVNPDLTPEQIALWHKVKDAYQYGDLEQLKAFSLIYEKELNHLAQQTQELSIEEILLRNENLNEGAKVLYDQIKVIKQQYPFTIEEQIRDEEWVTAEVGKIHELIQQLKGYEAELKERFDSLVNQKL